MAKMTLLAIVQNIMSAMDSDYVNDIDESVEAQEVATVVRETYFDLINNVLELPEHKEIISLTGLGDTDHPNYLQIPDDVKRIDYLRYNKETLTQTDLDYQDVHYLSPYDFQRRFNTRRESEDNVVVINDFNAGKLLIVNDKHPDFYTSFDDKYIVCDSWDNDTDSTLQSSKTFSYGLTEPTWVHSNTFVPDLDSHLFPLLLEEAKSTCFVEVKQVSNTKSEFKARRQITRIHNNVHRTKQRGTDRQPNYGRPRR